MASRILMTESEEILKHNCGPCENDGEKTNAEYFCEFCKVHLCIDCKNDHKSFKATKTHSVVSVAVGSEAVRFVVHCTCDQKRAVEVYWETHAEVICPSCEAIKHRNCKTGPIHDMINKETWNQFQAVVDKGKTLQTKVESCRRDREADRKKLEEVKETCMEEIKTFRQDILNTLDKMEKTLLKTLDEKTSEQLQTIEQHFTTLSTVEQALYQDINTLNDANETNKDEIMFVATVKISKRFSEYGKLIHDIRNEIQEPKLTLVKSKRFAEMLNSIDSLGRIDSSENLESHSIHPDSKVILDMKVKAVKKVKIKLSDENDDPWITGCAFLSGGSVIICDFGNSKIKLLDKSWSVKRSLKLTESPYNFAAVGEDEAIITYHGYNIKGFQFIYTNPDLKLGKKITTPDKCFGFQVVNNEIYTACHKNSENVKIWKLDRSGVRKRKICITQNCSYYPEHLSLGYVSDHGPCVYPTDVIHVSCFTLDRRKVFQFEDKALKGPYGIYVNADGNSIVCGSDSNNVVVITADGRKYREFLSSKDISKPRSIALRPEDDTLLVGCVNNSKCFVYKLEN